MANYTLNYTGEKVDELLNKIDTAFGEETVMGDTLTWDGDMTGKPVVSLDMGDGGVMNLCKVSEAVPTAEDLSEGITVTAEGAGTIETSSFLSGEGYIGTETVFFISQPNTVIEAYGLTFTEVGTWFLNATGMYVSALTIPNYTGFETTEVKTIDPKYIPGGASSDIVFNITGPNIGGEGGEVACNKSLGELMRMSDNELLGVRIIWTDDGGGSVEFRPVGAGRIENGIGVLFVAFVGGDIIPWRIYYSTDMFVLSNNL